MTLLRKQSQRELVDFIGKLQDGDVDIAQVSKAAFCKARKKLKPEAFIKLNEILIDTFYDPSNGEVRLWKDYRLLASDGSTAEYLIHWKFRMNGAFFNNDLMVKRFVWHVWSRPMMFLII